MKTAASIQLLMLRRWCMGIGLRKSRLWGDILNAPIVAHMKTNIQQLKVIIAGDAGRRWTNAMNQRTKRGIESACRASKESEFPRYHLGAALYYKGVLLATGCNSTKTSPLQKRLNAEREFDPNQSGVVNSLHAEIRALSKVKYLDIDFGKLTLYVYREYANGNKAMARPCPACMKYIKELGIKHICYSTADGIAEERID
jgi:hypothetical protein